MMELCVPFVLMVNCCEVLSVCIKLIFGRERVGAWGCKGNGGGFSLTVEGGY